MHTLLSPEDLTAGLFVRRAAFADLPAITHLLSADSSGFVRPRTPEQLRAMAALRQSLVATDFAGRVHVFAGARTWCDRTVLEWGPFCRSCESSGLQIGMAMPRLALAVAGGFDRIVGLVAPGNTRSLSNYRTIGFREIHDAEIRDEMDRENIGRDFALVGLDLRKEIAAELPALLLDLIAGRPLFGRTVSPRLHLGDEPEFRPYAADPPAKLRRQS